MKTLGFSATGLVLAAILCGDKPLGLSASAQAPLPRATPDAVGMSADRLQNATALLRQFVADRKISGAVAGVARRGKVVYLEPVGLQSFESRAPMTERSLFRDLFDDQAGHRRRGDDAERGRPVPARRSRLEVPPGVQGRDGAGAAEAATRHPSRADHDRGPPAAHLGLEPSDLAPLSQAQVRSRAITLPQFIDQHRAGAADGRPGHPVSLQRGTTVLGRLVEVWSGQPFDTFRDERILRPLGMNDTGFWVEPEARPRLATVYNRPGRRRCRRSRSKRCRSPNGRRCWKARWAGVDRAGLPALQPDAAQQGRARRRPADQRQDRRAMTANGLTPAVLQERGGRDGLGPRQRRRRRHAELARLSRPLAGEYGLGRIGGDDLLRSIPAREMVVILMTQNVPASPDGLRQKFKAAVQQSLVD